MKARKNKIIGIGICKWVFCIRTYVCVIFLFLFFKVNAQGKFTDDLRITAKYHYGYVIPEYQNFIYVVNDNIQSASLNISKKTTGKNDWEQLYNYPEYGLSLFYTSLGNDRVYGREIALYPYFNLDIVNYKRFGFYNQTGVGIGYVNKKFDLVENYQNVVVGSHLNIHFNTKLGIRYQLLDKFNFHAGLSFDHFSNGNSHEPNIGINSLTAYSGLSYLLGKKTEIVKHGLDALNRIHYCEWFYSIGGKHARALDSEFYFTSSVSGEFTWNMYRTFHIGAGADIFYDTSTESEMFAVKSGEYKKQDDFRSGIHISQSFVYNRLGLEFQEGIYLLLTDKVNHNVMYNRGILKYRISDRFTFRLAMKSHLYILDYPEIGIGIKL